ncbi:MAG: DUF5916 domain-containing protein [Acidobacteria bacterium]|nr:DUF5916 domain-containing protein [Acidobacteriota bacterium]
MGGRRQLTSRPHPAQRRRHPRRGPAVCCPRVWLPLALTLTWALPAHGAQAPAAAADTDQAVVIDGPPPPVPPAVFNRDAAGRMTIRAIRLTEPLDVDGTLDEPLYLDVPPLTGFVQVEPIEGAPATEETEVWLAFDDDNFYISVRCRDSAPESVWIANELRRDSFNIANNEYIDIVLDTFYDRRNGINLTVNPLGGRMDGQITDERDYTADWNPVWSVRAGRFDGGWTFESAIPFKSLRYRPGRSQVWGFSITRKVRWKNELSSLVPLPISRGIMLISQAATVVGIEAPDDGGRTLELKPYAIADLTTDRRAAPAVANDFSGEVGLDLKYGLTQNLVADLTVNTDFAQVEVDEQQVNLTRFGLFYPEKREFFLENQGVFAFGGTANSLFGNASLNVPILFYSRRIGLEQRDGALSEVPIDAGGRLTGRIGRFSIGALNIQTGDQPAADAVATNFSVLRVKGDVLRRSSVGAIFARRSVSRRAPGANATVGLDGTFSFYDDLNINTYWAGTDTAGMEDEVSYRAQLDYAGDRYGVQAERLVVGSGFNPEVGFMRREDFERSFASLRFSPRPQSIDAIRKFSWDASIDHITDRSGLLETREQYGHFGIEFENSDLFDVFYTRSYEFLKQPFEIAPEVVLPIDGYGFQQVEVLFALGQQRPFAGSLAVARGSFYGGDKTSVTLAQGRLEVTPRLSLEPSVSLNWIDLPQGRFSTELVTTRTTYSLSPLMFVSALVQYNSSTGSVGANVRLRWEYQPGSELFVVYNEARDTLRPGRPELQSRALIVKFNRLFRL